MSFTYIAKKAFLRSSMQPIDKLGRPIRDLRLSLTDRCNFRCAYCMPKEIFGPDYSFLPRESILTDDEILRLINAFSELGLEKVRLTGGEPLMRKGIIDLVHLIASQHPDFDLSLTTNATRLAGCAKELKAAGLRRVNVSLDALSEEVFSQMSGNKGSAQHVLNGVQAAVDAALEVKVNMVVRRGLNDSEILPMCRAFREIGVPLRFIEFMDVGNTNQWKLEEVFSAREILAEIETLYPLKPAKANYIGEVAKRYFYDDGKGEIGIISSVTQPFCQDCHRARVSADGQLFTCLFASKGHDLRSLLREQTDDEDLKSTLSNIWLRRTDRYSEERTTLTTKTQKVEMSFIGG